MVKHQRAKHDVVGLARIPLQNVCLNIGNFRISAAQLSRDLKRGSLPIQRVDLDLRADRPRMIDNQSRDITRTGGKIDNPEAITRFDPAPDEFRNEAITPEISIESTDV